MKDATTSTILDSTGNANSGTKKGANEPIEADGKIGKGQDFDGANDSINIGTTILNSVGAGSIGMWVNAHSASVNGGLVYQNDTLISNDDIYMGLQLMADYKIRAYYYDSLGVAQAYDSVDPIELNDWYRVVYDWDAATSRIYINGILNNDSDSLTWAKVHAGHVGQVNSLALSPAGKRYNGLLDEVRISANARSAAWIAYEYANMNPADGGLTWGAVCSVGTRWTRLAKGTNGDFLKMVSGYPAWVTP